MQKTLGFLFATALLVALTTTAEEVGSSDLAVDLQVDATTGVCSLTVVNDSDRDVVIFQAFNEADGMGADFPMGTSIQVEGSDDWQLCYAISSNLHDHGLITEQDGEGNVLKGPPQKELVLKSGEKIVRQFPLNVVLSWQHDLIERLPDKRVQVSDQFRLKAGVWVKHGLGQYEFVSDETAFIEFNQPFEWRM